jgi:hypothetical protein
VAQARLSMRKIREVLRPRAAGYSEREIAPLAIMDVFDQYLRARLACGWPRTLRQIGQRRRCCGRRLRSINPELIFTAYMSAPHRKLEIGVCECRPHTILALLHHGFGETDDIEGRKSGADVDFDSHLRCIYSALLTAEYGGDGHPLPRGWLIVFSPAAAALLSGRQVRLNCASREIAPHLFV